MLGISGTVPSGYALPYWPNVWNIDRAPMDYQTVARAVSLCEGDIWKQDGHEVMGVV
jgi:hypothetical protein